MNQVLYKIKNKETGKYFEYFMSTRGLRKDGKPRRVGPVYTEPKFGEFENAGYRDIESLNYVIQQGIDYNLSSTFDNCEVVAYTLQPTKTTLRLPTIRNRLEAKTIMAKLKA